MRNHARIAFQALFLVLLASCSSPDPRRTGWTPVQSEPGKVASPIVEAPTSTTPAATPLSAVVPAVGGDGSARWLSLSEWSMDLLGTVPRTVASDNGIVWELATPGGLMRLVPGSRRASWDGVVVWLGHAPFWSDGDCVIHELDLHKNLAPLAKGRPAVSNLWRTIVVDPGHGGTNTGTRSIEPPLLEKDLTLDWALRLEPLLRDLGWRVILTRTNDVDVSLSDRVRVADRHRADLFLSLHFNSAHPQTEQTGLETYCLTPAGLPSTLTRNYDDDPTRVFPNNAHDHDNLHFAFRLHHALIESTDTLDRGIRRARFMGVLRGQERPAVLIEAGYLSNPAEARRIATPAYRQRLAEAVAGALSDLATGAAPPAGGNPVPAAGRYP